jgi:K+-transporting ATPase ATPase C chain
MRSLLRASLVSFLILTIITGVIYPAVVTGIAHLAFAWQARGSVMYHDGKPIGSTLIGQPFTEARYFWPRPSATAAFPYDASAGSGSNLAPSNPALADAVKQRIAALRSADPGNTLPIPVDLVTASGSGLDPHISVAAVNYQASRVAKARGMEIHAVKALIERYTEGRTLGVLGESRVNVLAINLALDNPQAPATAEGRRGHRGSRCTAPRASFATTN